MLNLAYRNSQTAKLTPPKTTRYSNRLHPYSARFLFFFFFFFHFSCVKTQSGRPNKPRAASPGETGQTAQRAPEGHVVLLQPAAARQQQLRLGPLLRVLALGLGVGIFGGSLDVFGSLGFGWVGSSFRCGLAVLLGKTVWRRFGQVFG